MFGYNCLVDRETIDTTKHKNKVGDTKDGGIAATTPTNFPNKKDSLEEILMWNGNRLLENTETKRTRNRLRRQTRQVKVD